MSVEKTMKWEHDIYEDGSTLLSSDLILQAARMLNKEIEHPICTIILFDTTEEIICLINEETNEIYYHEIFGEE